GRGPGGPRGTRGGATRARPRPPARRRRDHGRRLGAGRPARALQARRRAPRRQAHGAAALRRPEPERLGDVVLAAERRRSGAPLPRARHLGRRGRRRPRALRGRRRDRVPPGGVVPPRHGARGRRRRGGQGARGRRPPRPGQRRVREGRRPPPGAARGLRPRRRRPATRRALRRGARGARRGELPAPRLRLLRPRDVGPRRGRPARPGPAPEAGPAVRPVPAHPPRRAAVPARAGRPSRRYAPLMLAKRIVPCLDVHAGRVTRGQQFGRAERGELLDVGDPVALATVYDRQGADELVFYDITATAEGRGAILDVLAQVAERCFMPITAGGGVRTLDDFRALTLAGADKVSLNSGALAAPALITAAAERFGSQAVVLSADYRRSESGWEVYAAGGRRATGLDLLEWVVRGQELGAGEVVLNSIDADGMGSGFDLDAVRAVAAAVDVPVVASGGAGRAEDLRDVLLLGGADAALAAGIFHRGETTVGEVKRVCLEAGLAVRPPEGVMAEDAA